MRLSKETDLKIERNFENLAKKLDKVLIFFNQDLYILCNSYLHLSRNHPDYLGLWANLIFNQKRFKVEYFKVPLLLIARVSYFLIKIFLSLLSKNKKNRKNMLYYNCDFFFISHLVEKDVKDEDFYFGRLLIDITKSNKKLIRLLLPHLGGRLEIPVSQNYETRLIKDSLSKNETLKYLYHNLVSAKKLFFFTLKNNFSFYEIVVLLIGQFSNSRLVSIVINIEKDLAIFKPKNVVITYEGNALEKVIFSICKQKNILSFGYQHAPIIKSQHSIFRPLNNGLDPDVILASGPYTASKFKDRFPSSKRVLTLGSPKFVKFPNNKLSAASKDQILLVPDGSLTSIDEFINLGLYLSKNISSKKIVIRAHPLFNAYLEKKIHSLGKDNLSTFLSSQSDLSKDLIHGDFLIYKNSSVCLQGLLHGCKVIYFNTSSSNVDPLWELAKLHLEASSFVEVEKIVKEANTSSSPDFKKLHSIGEMYFSQLQLETILSFDSKNLEN